MNGFTLDPSGANEILVELFHAEHQVAHALAARVRRCARSRSRAGNFSDAAITTRDVPLDLREAKNILTVKPRGISFSAT